MCAHTDFCFWSRLLTDLYLWSAHGRSPSGMSSGRRASSPALCKGAVCGYGSWSGGGSRLGVSLCECLQIQIQGQGQLVT